MDQIRLMNTDQSIIDRIFYDTVLSRCLDQRNEGRRTRGQKQQNLEFLFKQVHSGHELPMEIDEANYPNQSSTESGVPMKYSSSYMHIDHSINVEPYDSFAAGMNSTNLAPPKMPDMIEIPSDDDPMSESSIRKIRVRFIQVETETEIRCKEFDRNEQLERVLQDYAQFWDKNMKDVDFSLKNLHDKPFETTNLLRDLTLNDRQMEMEIYVKDKVKRARTSKQTTSIDQSQKTNQRQGSKLYLQFKDKMAIREPLDLVFNASEKLSVAIGQLVSVMELKKSNLHFFDSNGIFQSKATLFYLYIN